MDQKLHGRSVLVVEREELIAIVIAQVFEEVGAIVTARSSVEDTVALLGRGMFSAAVLDHKLFHGKANCGSLKNVAFRTCYTTVCSRCIAQGAMN